MRREKEQQPGQIVARPPWKHFQKSTGREKEKTLRQKPESF